MSIPPGLQDMIVTLISITVFGNAVSFVMDLWRTSPVSGILFLSSLLMLPAIFVYFLVSRSRFTDQSTVKVSPIALEEKSIISRSKDVTTVAGSLEPRRQSLLLGLDVARELGGEHLHGSACGLKRDQVLEGLASQTKCDQYMKCGESNGGMVKSDSEGVSGSINPTPKTLFEYYGDLSEASSVHSSTASEGSLKWGEISSESSDISGSMNPSPKTLFEGYGKLNEASSVHRDTASEGSLKWGEISSESSDADSL